MPAPIRLPQLLAALALTLALAACSGGSAPSNPPQASIPAPVQPTPSPAPPSSPQPVTTSWATRGVALDPVVAAQILASAEFRAADANCTYAGCATSGVAAANQSQAYALHNLHEALSSGLRGANQLVAVVDEGFRITHQEFAGKSILQNGVLPVKDHGTHVASLIAGKRDGVGMHGVAPEANLHLTAINPTGASTLDIANVTQGTLHAASLGAVAQNNSWGFNVAASALQNHLNANPGQSVAQGLNSVVANYGTNRWQAYIDALATFENGGVVVWSLSNDNSIASGDIMATLPYFEPRLQGSWIAAANGYFEVNATGGITKAIRLSAPCGLAASFCIAGDGTTRAASAASDTSYATGTGTSYVAPQISGAVALLAEAFPDLSSEEWAKRLLASADNSWFSALGVPVAGSVDFGNGVSHSYSGEWGHGVLDIAAALRPIGSVAVLSGDNVVTSERASLADSTLVAPSAFGDGLAAGLAPNDIAVFDSMNRGFAVEGSALVAKPRSTMLPELLASVSGPAFGAAPTFKQVQESQGATPAARVALLGNAAGVFETTGSGVLNNRASVFSNARNALTVVSTSDSGPLSITAVGIAGQGAEGRGGVGGTGLNLALAGGGSRISLGMSYLGEEGSVLGLGRNAAFGLGSGGVTGAAHLGIDQALTPKLSLFGRLEYGVARQMGTTSGLVSGLSDMQFSGFELGARMSDVFSNNDVAGISISQPLRVEGGAMGLNLPVSRSADGTIEHRKATADLAPSGRELDLDLSYAVPVNSGKLQLGLQYRFDAGHVEGASAAGAAVSFQQAF